MPETIIQSVLSHKISLEVLVKWLNDEAIEDTPEYNALFCYSRSEFVAYFISFLRSQTDSILQTNSTALNLIQHQGTPEKILGRKHRRSVSEPTSEVDGQKNTDSLSVKTDRNRSHESPNRDKSAQKKTGRRVKTKLFSDTDRSNPSLNLSVSSSKTDSDESRLSCGVERLILSSTPLKNGASPTDYPNLPLTSPVTPQSRSFGNYERCDTPRSGYRHSRSQDKSLFGDFLANAQVKSAKKKRTTPKKISNEAEDSKVLDLSSSEMFPEIGVRKSSSLKSEKRRIKPTNIDTTPQKSFSLNSFNSESFQQPSPLALEENQAFKQQKLQPNELANSFDVERSILKQERQKLMEKFNILNISSSQKTPQTPTIKVTKKDSFEKQHFINADASKVTFKEEIDILVEIYKILLKDNMILSLSSEIYYLISILMSQQYENDYLEAESKLNQQNLEFILKIIHNSTNFAVKSLWHQRLILEFMLDKNSLKVLGEHKKVRSFYPDLAKFLLNLYGVKCEADRPKGDKSLSVIVLQNRYTNGMVCFNFETDNADNFPSLLSFQNFKKQRDMFYEILRWYTETQHNGSSKSTFRSRVKALISLAVSPLNHAHLARLCTSHMLAECLPATQQESKLSKLHRRLTGPSTHESHRLPSFNDKETFYKEFIIFAENESFRAHLRDSLASEVCALNATPIGNSDDRASTTSADTAKDYLDLLKKLRLVSKFLGFLTALPYTPLPLEYSTKTGAVHSALQREQKIIVPKEKVLENELAMRNYIQPSIDLKGLLAESNEKARLCITLPWIVQYLSMLDYTTLRTSYHQQLLSYLFEIYTLKLKLDNGNMKLNTVIFLKLTLGWLFDLPQFPQDLFYSRQKFNMVASFASEENVDSLELIDDSILFEVCPFLKDINVLLLTCRPAQDLKEGGSFRHITPVTMSLNPEERIRNKEKEIQARLEEEFLKSVPSSTRRVLELATERVTSRRVKCLAGAARDCRARSRTLAHRALAQHKTDPVQTVREIYTSQLDILRSSALEASRRVIAEQASMALQALLVPGSNRKALEAVLVRSCLNRVNKWICDHWDTTDVLCKDIEGEVKNLLVLGDSVLLEEPNPNTDNVHNMTLPEDEFCRVNVSPSAVIIDLKEQICLLLEDSPPTSLSSCLSLSARVCARGNVFTRAPTQRTIAQLTRDLLVTVVSKKPDLITEAFLNQLHKIWNQCCPDRKRNSPEESPDIRPDSASSRDFGQDDRMPTPTSDDESGVNSAKTVVLKEDCTAKSDRTDLTSKETQMFEASMKTNAEQNTELVTTQNRTISTKTDQISAQTSKTAEKIENSEPCDSLLECFDRMLCPRNIVLLSNTKHEPAIVWETMAKVLVFMLKNDYLTEDSLTEQCLAVYRQEWPQNTLQNLSACMKSVARQWSRGSKFTLFLDLLAEYCGDLDCGV